MSTKLIDLSFSHLLAADNIPGLKIKIAVVIKPGKEAVYTYLTDRYPGFNFEMVYFNNRFEEWPGSIYSASESYSEFNLVLLPDTDLHLSSDSKCLTTDGLSLIEKNLNQLNHFLTSFGYIENSNADMLQNLGAIYVKEEKIIRFQDKPQKHFERYNGFWGCFGFRKKVGENLYRFLLASVKKKNCDDSMPFNASGFRLHSFIDLGTWENIYKFNS